MLYFVVTFLIIWLLVLQSKISDISVAVKNLEKKVKELSPKKFEDFKEKEFTENQNKIINSFDLSKAKDENKTEIKTENTTETNNLNLNNTTQNISSEQVLEPKINMTNESEIEPAVKIHDELSGKNTVHNADKSIINVKDKEKTNFESIFMGNIFNKIGAIAIFIGICFFIKIVSPYIVFTDEMKIGLSYLLSAILIGVSFRMHLTEKMKLYSEVLMGTGFGIIFITTYCGTTWLSVIPSTIATVIATLTTIATYFLADKQKSSYMLGIGLVAGYMNPFFVNPYINMTFLFSYLLFLNLISLIFVFRNKNKQIINLINLVVTGFTILIFHSTNNDHYSVLFIISLWISYILFDILSFKTLKFDAPLYKVQTYLNFSVLSCLSLMLFKENLINIGIILLGASVVYVVLGVLLYNFYKKEENSYLNSFFIAIFLSTFFLTKDTMRIAMWSFEAFLIAFISLKYKFKILPKFVLCFLVSAITNLFLNTEIYSISTKIILNARLLNFLPITVFSFLTALCYKKLDKINISQILNFIGITLVYTFILLEIYSFFSMKTNNLFYLQLISYSIVGFIYTINLKYIYSKSKYSLFNMVSDWTYGISIILMFVAENFATFNNMHFLNVRLINYLFAIGVSYKLYNMTKKDIFKFLSVTLGYIFATIEIYNLLSNNNSLFENSLVYISIMLIYTINLKLLPSNKEHLFEIISAYCFAISLVTLLSLELIFQAKITNIFNLRLLTYPLIMYNFYLLKKDKMNWLQSIYKNEEYKKTIEAVKYLMILTVFAYVHFESANIVHNFEFLNINWLISLMWTLYIGIISIFGIFKNIKCLKISGIWLSFFVIGRIFLYDLANMDIIVKLTLFITLGAVLMLISYFYNKYKK